MRVIILAAGQGYELGGFPKILIRDPETGQRIIDRYLETFRDRQITLVVGYRAIEIMHRYPRLHYVYNEDWKVTNNSYSLGIALDGTPCYVVSSDLIFDPEIIRIMDAAGPNAMLTDNTENRTLNALNCMVEDRGRVTEIYQGESRSKTDPESMGIFKVSDPVIIKLWKQCCLEHSNLFVGQNLPLDMEPIYAVDRQGLRFDEINTPMDYIRLLEQINRG